MTKIRSADIRLPSFVIRPMDIAITRAIVGINPVQVIYLWIDRWVDWSAPWHLDRNSRRHAKTYKGTPISCPFVCLREFATGVLIALGRSNLGFKLSIDDCRLGLRLSSPEVRRARFWGGADEWYFLFFLLFVFSAMSEKTNNR
jgi:hypothetical protein